MPIIALLTLNSHHKLRTHVDLEAARGPHSDQSYVYTTRSRTIDNTVHWIKTICMKDVQVVNNAVVNILK